MLREREYMRMYIGALPSLAQMAALIPARSRAIGAAAAATAFVSAE
jgi:hypothetical protein